MSTLSADTAPEAERVQIELIRQAPAWRRVELAGQMYEAVKALAMSGLRRRHPHAAPQELRRRLADLLLGPELAMRVYGPLIEGESFDVKR
jgi:hypothetical protein